jgi:hypothetical protein
MFANETRRELSAASPAGTTQIGSLSGDIRDQVEIALVVQGLDPDLLSRGGNEKIRVSSGPLAALGKEQPPGPAITSWALTHRLTEDSTN